MLSDRLKQQPILLVTIGLIAGAIAMITIGLISLRDAESDVVIIYGQGATEVTVDVRGAVQTPGLVTLPAGSRVGDAIDAAGGLTDDADLVLINRARRLEDGEMLIIPVRVVVASPVDLAGAPVEPTSEAIQGISYRINVNTASQAELESLPGIGPVIAERIIVFRTQNGPFTAAEQLLEVEGISENLLDEIQSLITLGP